jgi:hypothetical protein
MGGENLLVIEDEVGGRHRFRHGARVLDRRTFSMPSAPGGTDRRVAFAHEVVSREV